MIIKRPPNRRWLRLVIPYAIVFTALIGSTIAYSVEQPDVTNAAYLSPTSSDDIGGQSLAQALTQRGISVNPVDQTSEALVQAMEATAGATIFIPAPTLVHPYYLRMIKFLPATTTVVIVAPTSEVLGLGLIDASVDQVRLAAKTTSPNCSYAPAAQAGLASVYRTRYEVADATTAETCYDGALAVVTKGAARVVLVGADDPFRNDRIQEYHNADLATGLLSTSQTLIWLDLHAAESRPTYIDDPSLADDPAAPPSLGPGSPDPDFEIPTDNDETDDGEEDTAADDSSGGDYSNPLWQAFPPWVFVAVILTAMATFLLALARGRRLGGPVEEPLPIVVQATETVEGKGRLYQRAKARDVAIVTLRERAIQRLTHLLDLPPATDRWEIERLVSAASGWHPQHVAALLYDDSPQDDQSLVTMAAALERLVSDTAHEGPKGEAR